jgi:hypothetical protein
MDAILKRGFRAGAARAHNVENQAATRGALLDSERPLFSFSPAQGPVVEGRFERFLELVFGVSNGDRTRDNRSHNPVLYH